MGLGNRKDVWYTYGGKWEGGQETVWDWVTEWFTVVQKWEGGQESARDWVKERTFGTSESGKVDKKLHWIG